MSQGFQKPGFGVWPPGMPAFQKTDSTLTLYLDPVGGDDDKVGTSRVNAVRTPARIADLIPLYCGNVDVRMRLGLAVLPERGWFLAPRLLNGLIRFTADETWDPSVFTVVGGNRTAAAATTGVVVKAAGLVVNALRDMSMRFTTGPAAGQYRRVRNNTATDIIPTATFDPAPDPGDTYQIFTSNARFGLPSTGAAPLTTDYVFCGDCLGANASGAYDYPFWFGDDRAIAQPRGLLFDGVGLEGGADYFYYTFGRVPVSFLGTDANTNFLDVLIPISGTETAFLSGLSNSRADALKEGWGLAAPSTPFLNAGGSLAGNFSVERHLQYVACDCTFFGGRYGAVIVYGGKHSFIDDVVGFLIPCRIDSSYGGYTVLASSDVFVTFGDSVAHTEIPGGNVTVRGRGATIEISNVVTGSGPVNIIDGGFLNMSGGVPQLGGAGNDWTCFGIAAFNKSFFAASGALKLGTDTSLAKRSF